MNQMGCIGSQQSTLPQCITDKCDISLLQITDSTMNQLGTATRSPLTEIRSRKNEALGRKPPEGDILCKCSLFEKMIRSQAMA